MLLSRYILNDYPVERPTVTIKPIIKGQENNDIAFIIKTYMFLIKYSKDYKLDASNQKYFDDNFDIPNQFLKTLNNKEDIRMFQFYKTMFDKLNTITKENFKDIILFVEEELESLDKDLDFINKFYKYMMTVDIQYPDLSLVGTRVHDREDLTFFKEEYKILTALASILKLICPIFGHFIYRTKSFISVDDKEYFCLNMIFPILNHPVFKNTTYKLEHYIKNSVNNTLTQKRKLMRPYQDIDFTLAADNIESEYLTNIIFGNVTVKKLINYIPTPGYIKEVEPKDIMRDISSCVRSSTDNKISTFSKKSQYLVRSDLSSSENNFSNESESSLEYNSTNSKITPDIPILIEVATDKLIKKYLEKYQFNKTIFDEVVSYYRKNRIEGISDMTLSIISLSVGIEIGGPRSLKYLKYDQIIKLISLCQMMFIENRIVGTPQLIHFMSANKCEYLQTQENDLIKTQIKMKMKSTEEYNFLLTNIYTTVIHKYSLERCLDKMLDNIILNGRLYNTAPALLDIMELDRKINNTYFHYTEDFFSEFMRFVISMNVDNNENIAI